MQRQRGESTREPLHRPSRWAGGRASGNDARSSFASARLHPRTVTRDSIKQFWGGSLATAPLPALERHLVLRSP
jgi:hypothetical protein